MNRDDAEKHVFTCAKLEQQAVQRLVREEVLAPWSGGFGSMPRPSYPTPISNAWTDYCATLAREWPGPDAIAALIHALEVCLQHGQAAMELEERERRG